MHHGGETAGGGQGEAVASNNLPRPPWFQDKPGPFLAQDSTLPTPALPHDSLLLPAGPQESASSKAWVIQMQTILCKPSEHYSNHFCEGFFWCSPASLICTLPHLP